MKALGALYTLCWCAYAIGSQAIPVAPATRQPVPVTQTAPLQANVVPQAPTVPPLAEPIATALNAPTEEAELTPEELNRDTCPALPDIEANATVGTLRDVIRLLNQGSTFKLAEPLDEATLSDTERILYDMFGKENYIQLQNPAYKRAKDITTAVLTANEDIDAECVLRTYILERGKQAAAVEGETGRPKPKPASTSVETPADKPSLTPAPKPGPAIDLKPINDTVGKLNGALSRIRNAKQVKMTPAQRMELKKEAEKLFKENNSKLKIMAQRVKNILAEPGFSGNPEKIAPFKRMAELYDALDAEIARG